MSGRVTPQMEELVKEETSREDTSEDQQIETGPTDKCRKRKHQEVEGAVCSTDVKLDETTSPVAVRRCIRVASGLHKAQKSRTAVQRIGREQKEAFYRLLEDDVLQRFLKADKCRKISDKLQVLRVIFPGLHCGITAGTPVRNPAVLGGPQLEDVCALHTDILQCCPKLPSGPQSQNIGVTFIANSMEEDEHFYGEIFPWALGRAWKKQLPRFNLLRDGLWKKLDYRAYVRREDSEQMMTENPSHWAWARIRKEHHGVAIRSFRRSDAEYKIYGPEQHPFVCDICSCNHAPSSRLMQAVPDEFSTAEESYNFFTFNYDLEPSEAEEESLVQGDDLFVIDQNSQDFVALSPAPYDGCHSQLEKEKDLIFIPSIRTVPTSQKVPENMLPRYLEEEGLFTGERPKISQTSENILENRILRQGEGRKWFGDDGKILANPIKTSSTRPPIFSLRKGIDPALETEYIKAIPPKHTNQCCIGLQGDFQLDIDISGIVFTHHPLFSREHVLASKLEHLYDQHLRRKQQNLSSLLTVKLHALRNTVQNISASNAVHGSSRTDYIKQIRLTRKHRDGEQKEDRALLKSIIKVWKEIKFLRAFQRFTNTPLKLCLRKKDVNKKKDEEEYEAEIQAEIHELMEEYMEDYEKNRAQYKRDLHKWKAWRRAQKKKTKMETSGQKDNTEPTYSGENPIMPSPPVMMDRRDIEQQVRDKAASIRRRPGKPIVIPELSLSAPITPSYMCPRMEVLRREDIQKHSVYIKILSNDKVVWRTVKSRLGPDFRVHMGQIANLQIFSWPESIKLQIYETVHGKCGTTLLAEVFVPGPVLSGHAPVENAEFSSFQRVMFHHEGVGSNVPFSFEADGSNKISLMTSGKVSYCISWAVGDNGVPLVPPVLKKSTSSQRAFSSIDAVASIGASGLTDMKKLAKWAEESKADPNDPRNASLMQLLMIANSRESNAPAFFRLDPFQKEFDFVSDEELKRRSKRFRLFQLCKQVVAKFRNYKPKVKQSVTKRFLTSKHHVNLSDLVVEEGMPRLGIRVLNLLKLAETKLAEMKWPWSL
ncbi:coiled-coil and C2 domain-containing protein 2A-like [Pelodytes ibericus]